VLEKKDNPGLYRRTAMKRLFVPTFLIATSIAAWHMFYSRPNLGAVNLNVKRINTISLRHGWSASWNCNSPDLLYMDSFPPQRHRMGRKEIHDAASDYYWDFVVARRASGYSLLQSMKCTVEVRISGRTLVRRRGPFLESDAFL
jgi:hypothetical protein